ncbi:ECF-type sigma factor [Planctomicrobium sp.]|nr:ECF-type sigma factor [Planctomicrobium sp.]
MPCLNLQFRRIALEYRLIIEIAFDYSLYSNEIDRPGDFVVSLGMLKRHTMSVDLPNEELIQLIVLAKNGDEDALGKLLDQHRDQLRRLAESELSQKLSKRVDASDVVQQTYLSVCKKVEQFQGENIEEFVAWVFQIHRHNIKVRHDNMSQLQNEM